MKIALINTILLLSFSLLWSQILYDRYVNFKIGQGISFGGTGIATEYRYKKLSILGSLGYQREQNIYDHDVPSSWNISSNLRYYLSRKNGNWQIYSGLHVGWLSNYYHPDIGKKDYKYNVYGLAFQLGIEIREELLNFEIGMAVDPGSLTFNTAKHPFYNSNWYFASNLGIGINLFALSSNLKYNRNKEKKVKNTIPSYSSFNENNITATSADSIHTKLIQQQAKTILDWCSQTVKSPYDRVFYLHDTLYIWKPIGSSRSLYIKMLVRDIHKEQFMCVSLMSKLVEQKVFLIYDKISKPASEDLPFLMEEIEHYSAANKGLLCLYIRIPYIYLSLENLEFSKSGVNIMIDKAIACEMKLH